MGCSGRPLVRPWGARPARDGGQPGSDWLRAGMRRPHLGWSRRPHGIGPASVARDFGNRKTGPLGWASGGLLGRAVPARWAPWHPAWSPCSSGALPFRAISKGHEGLRGRSEQGFSNASSVGRFGAVLSARHGGPDVVGLLPGEGSPVPAHRGVIATCPCRDGCWFARDSRRGGVPLGLHRPPWAVASWPLSLDVGFGA